MSEIPSGWHVRKLGDIATIVRGASPRPKGDPRYFGGQIPWITITDINAEPGRWLTRTREHVTEAGAERSRRLPQGTLIVSNSASVGIPKILGCEGCIHDGFVALLNLHPDLDRDFVYEFFRFIRPKLIRENKQGMTQVNLNTEIVKAIEVVMPPLDQQRRIVAKIEALTDKSRRAKQALDAIPPLLERFRQSVLASAFRGDLTKDWRAKNPDVEPASELLKRIRVERRALWEAAELAKLKAKGKKPTDDKWKLKYEEPAPVDTDGLPELPAGWCWASVGDLASDQPRSIQSGPFGSNLKHEEFQPTGVLAIGIDNVHRAEFRMGNQNRISAVKYEELKKYTARPRDLLVTVMATVGRCCLVPDDIEAAIITKHVYRVSLEQRLITPAVAMYALQGAVSVLRQLDDGVQGQTRDGINGTILKTIVLPVPPQPEQAVLLNRVEKLLLALKAQAACITEARDRIAVLDASILAKAFRGELVENGVTSLVTS